MDTELYSAIAKNVGINEISLIPEDAKELAFYEDSVGLWIVQSGSSKIQIASEAQSSKQLDLLNEVVDELIDQGTTVCVDFEFVNQKIRQLNLIQLRFRIGSTKLIIIVDPAHCCRYNQAFSGAEEPETRRESSIKNNSLSFPTETKYLFKILHKLLTDPRIYKIVHGSESNDVPFIYEQIGCRGIDLIYHWVDIKPLYETLSKYIEFLSDVGNTDIKEREHLQKLMSGTKSNIYQIYSAMEVISPSVLQKLEEIDKRLGRKVNTGWTLIPSSENQKSKVIDDLSYSIGDVLYLEEARNAMNSYFIKFKQIPYRDVMMDLYRFITIERQENQMKTAHLKEDVEKMNTLLYPIESNFIQLAVIVTEMLKAKDWKSQANLAIRMNLMPPSFLSGVITQNSVVPSDADDKSTDTKILESVLARFREDMKIPFLCERYNLHPSMMTSVEYMKSLGIFFFRLAVYYSVMKRKTSVYLNKKTKGDMSSINGSYIQLKTICSNYRCNELIYFLDVLVKYVDAWFERMTYLQSN
jgi:hypothetical protein